jgi:hypothetical protein
MSRHSRSRRGRNYRSYRIRSLKNKSRELPGSSPVQLNCELGSLSEEPLVDVARNTSYRKPRVIAPV